MRSEVQRTSIREGVLEIYPLCSLDQYASLLNRLIVLLGPLSSDQIAVIIAHFAFNIAVGRSGVQ